MLTILWVIVQAAYFIGLCVFLWTGYKEMNVDLSKTDEPTIRDIIRLQYVQEIPLYLAWPVTSPISVLQAHLMKKVDKEEE